MKTVKDILFELDLLVPSKLIVEVDNCGLIIGDMSSKVTACVMALDVTNDIVDLAIKQKAELIITHHPIIFDPLSTISYNSIVHKVVRNKLNVICVHSNLDAVSGGVNSVLINLLGITGSKMLKNTNHMGRIGRLKTDMNGVDLARFAKTMTHSPTANVSNGGNVISTVAVLGGSGGSYIKTAFDEGADAFITGEVKHSDYIYAINSGKTLITIGHHYSEVQVLNVLKAKLKTVLNEVVFIVDDNYKITVV